jgi:hypothetical protein
MAKTTRNALTTKDNRALCAQYRNRGACRRVARFIVVHPGHGKAVCAQCKDKLVAAGGRVLAESPKGFKVREGGWSGWVSREYVALSGEHKGMRF